MCRGRCAAIDAWIASSSDKTLTRAHAIRRLVAFGLKAKKQGGRSSEGQKLRARRWLPTRLTKWPTGRQSQRIKPAARSACSKDRKNFRRQGSIKQTGKPDLERSHPPAGF